ncbi:MAG TPA: hypothetical protein VKU94_06730 [Geobacterales bacterium]|nr:hypothetical protein [Geobacterales bacterium]
MDLLNALQEKIDEIAKEQYKNDNCPPIFTVSLIQRYGDNGKINQHEIGLTIQHMGQAYTRTLFPQVNKHYGYPNLEKEMKDLYNNTM